MKVLPQQDSYQLLSRCLSFLSLIGIVVLVCAVYLDWKILRDLRLPAVLSMCGAGFLIALTFGRLAKISRMLLCCLTMWVLIWVQASDITQDNKVFFGLPWERVTIIEGSLIADSSLSAQENQVLNLTLKSCDTGSGTSADAHGTLLAIGGRHDFIPAGSNLLLSGALITVDEGKFLFLTESIDVRIPTNPLLHHMRMLRKRLLLGLLNRFEPLGYGPAELCGLLLLGRTDQTGSSIKEASVESGCAHILALSGMHLQIMAGIAASIVSLFFGKRTGRNVSVIPVVAFLGIAGPKPSLVRSAAMYFLALDPKRRCSVRYALFIACVVQLFFFPNTIATLGCVLSYSSLAGMMLVQETVSQAVRTFLPRRLAAVLSAHASALVFAGPCAIAVFGCWYPIGLLIVPLVGPLAFLYMALGLFWLFFPLTATAYLLQQVYRLFLFLLGVGASWSHAHPLMGSPGHLFIYLATLLTVVGFLLYACRIARTRSAHRHDMGLSLRFPECNHRLIG